MIHFISAFFMPHPCWFRRRPFRLFGHSFTAQCRLCRVDACIRTVLERSLIQVEVVLKLW